MCRSSGRPRDPKCGRALRRPDRPAVLVGAQPPADWGRDEHSPGRVAGSLGSWSEPAGLETTTHGPFVSHADQLDGVSLCGLINVDAASCRIPNASDAGTMPEHTHGDWKRSAALAQSSRMYVQ